MKKYLLSVALRHMQTKTVVRFHPSLPKGQTANTGENVGKEESLHSS